MEILLSGPDFHDYNEFVANGFEELGHDVAVSRWPELWGRLNRRARLYVAKRYLPEYQFQEYVLEVIDDVIQRYNTQLLERIRTESPDIFMTLNGKILLPETIETANEYTTTVMWCYDKATAFPAVVEGAAHYDLFYAFESSDVSDLGERGVDVTFLPMGYDPTYYHETDEDETIDVSFVGSLDDRRKRLLERVATELPECDLQVWGNNWSWYDPFAQFEYRVRRRKLGNCVHNYNLPAASVNEVYNRSKICVNIHGPHSKRAMNPRTFEILGSGTFELVDYKPRLPEQLDIGTEVVTYETGDEFVEVIDYYLDNPVERNEIAARGHQRVQEDHTYSDRLQRIIADYHDRS